MHPTTHLLTGWAVATALPLSRRDRALVCLAGLIPDLDGLGIIVEKLTLHSERPLYWYAEYHHVLAHNLAFGLAITAGAAAVARRRLAAAALVLGSFHLHLLGDLAGSGGPDGASWPLRYGWPFLAAEQSWQGQWAINAWPNLAITVALLLWASWVAASRGHSPVELISSRADAVFCATMRRWWRR